MGISVVWNGWPLTDGLSHEVTPLNKRPNNVFRIVVGQFFDRVKSVGGAVRQCKTPRSFADKVGRHFLGDQPLWTDPCGNLVVRCSCLCSQETPARKLNNVGGRSISSSPLRPSKDGPWAEKPWLVMVDEGVPQKRITLIVWYSLYTDTSTSVWWIQLDISQGLMTSDMVTSLNPVRLRCSAFSQRAMLRHELTTGCRSFRRQLAVSDVHLCLDSGCEPSNRGQDILVQNTLAVFWVNLFPSKINGPPTQGRMTSYSCFRDRK